MKKIFKSYLNDLLLLITLASCIGILLVSCATHRQVEALPLKDSIRVETVERTVVERDTLYFALPAQSTAQTLRDSSSHLETDYASSDARINADGSLYHDLRNKPQEQAVETETRTVYKTRTEWRDREVPVRVEVEAPLSAWQRLKLSLGGYALTVCLLLLGYTTWRVVKAIRP